MKRWRTAYLACAALTAALYGPVLIRDAITGRREDGSPTHPVAQVATLTALVAASPAVVAALGLLGVRIAAEYARTRR